MSTPLLDLPRLATTIRRHRRFWLGLGLLGLAAGALLTFVLPPAPSALARVLVIHENDQPSDGGAQIQTDIALLETTRIAAAALERLGTPEDPEEFLASYSGTGITSNVLQVTVTGSSDADAVAKATALVEVFIADHLRRLDQAADAQAQALRDQRGQAEDELAGIDRSIAELSQQDSTASAAQLQSLYGRRAELAQQIADLSRRADEAAIGSPSVAAGTQVVDAPRPVREPLLRTLGTNAGFGLVLGVVLGLALVAVRGVVRDRPVLRRDIADHLGASVLAQLPKGRRHSVAARERKRVALTLARLIRNGSGGVSLLELGCARTTAALALSLAEELAIDGRVILLDGLPGRQLSALGGRTERPISIVEPEKLPLTVWPEEHNIGVGSVGPGTAWTDLGALGSETVLVVRAGYADTRWLHTVARQLADAAIPVIGVVLVDPDPKDRTDGTLWDALHTALRGRANHAERTANGNGHQLADLPTTRFTPVRAAEGEGS
ncbi:Wzz/FepE/Etk N-terminal domain-containing protein [Saccharomonospora sp. NPDC046836]|uniref:Wzz/FepE/Etk N-terminal domain-containing protein n=1 Tax=Saccharomonospora sp. NPDC046836 TaxID=3156921 RepID=UPI0033DEEC40